MEHTTNIPTEVADLILDYAGRTRELHRHIEELRAYSAYLEQQLDEERRLRRQGWMTTRRTRHRRVRHPTPYES